MGFSPNFASAEEEDLEERVDELERSVSKLRSANLKVGYINANQAFTAFANVVQEQNEKAREKEEEILELRSALAQEEITEEEYREQNYLLQAEKLQAQLGANIVMLETMIDASGFQGINDKLKDLDEQVSPVEEELGELVQELEAGPLPPEEVERILQRIDNQYNQLDKLLMQVIEAKIMDITSAIADSQGYDLVFRQQNVLLYRDSAVVTDLTEDVQERLSEELES
ncbi:MAG: hypothetical protein ACOCZX_04875 [Candidatus Bipolaricaulota bacterium]